VSSHDTVGKTIKVALALCVVCSLVVSTAAVVLKPMQLANKELDRQSNILAAAGLLQEGASVEEQFKQITTKVVDLRTGKFTTEVEAATYDQAAAAKDPALSLDLGEGDIARVGRRENLALVYLVESNGQVDKVILPIRGAGLWSTLYGFIALEGDANTVAGLGFYAHGETPGLGGEVDNPRWKAQWQGKQVYKSGEAALGLIKGTVNPDSADATYQVDGLAGATLTGNGVTNLVKFWLGENGFKAFLSNLRAGEA
jgi:Na+-transporting NADH:ubiquinone oxidoreductase subunit C